MSIKWFNRQALTGGGVTALDAIPSVGIDHGDRAFVLMPDGLFYTYEFDSTSTLSESSPTVIRPDDYTTGGVWRLKRWSDAMPVGSCTLWPTDTPPAQHMLCYNQGLSTAAYPELFSVLGYMYGGSGDTFYLPGPQGLFPRFTDNGAGVDPNASTRTDRGDGTTGDNVGTKQGYATARPSTPFSTNTDTHRHETGFNNGTNGTTGFKPLLGEGIETELYTSYDSHSHTITGGGDSETRSKNMNFNLAIKYE